MYNRDDNADLMRLPIGRTCFFRLELPAYKSEDVLRDKLLFAIRYCTAIDADIEGAVHNEEEQSEPREEPRRDGSDNGSQHDDHEHQMHDDNNYEDEEEDANNDDGGEEGSHLGSEDE